MDNNDASLVQLLGATLSSENATRRSAEQNLDELAKTPGLAGRLLQLVGREDTDQETRVAGAIKFKNFVRENWSGDGDAPLDDAERLAIRDGVLQLLFRVPAVYRRHLSQASCIIGQRDFPSDWPALIEVIRDCLINSTDNEQLNAAMSTLEELVKRYRYEMRSNKLYSEILIVVKAIAEPMTQLFSRLINCLPSESSGYDPMPLAERKAHLELLFLIVRTYHSLISQDLPEFFEDNLTEWMGGFANLLKVSLPTLEAETIDTEANQLDKIRATICQIVTMFSQRYEDCFEQYVKLFIGTIWQLLVNIDSRTRFDALVNSALGFLSAICQRHQYSGDFRGENVLQLICENVVVKNLMLRQEDLNMYECEPFEFLKRDIEGSDLETRRRGASDFVRALCKFFEEDVFRILSGIINVFLADFAADPAGNFAKKDAVIYLVSAIASKATTERLGVTATSQLINVSDFYGQFVRVDLLLNGVNELPILKCDAFKFLVLFRNQLRSEYIVECIRGVDGQPAQSVARLLGSGHVVLHHYAAYAIERLLLVKGTNRQLLFNSSNVPVKAFADGLFACFVHEHAYATPYIIKALMRVFTIIDDETARSAHVYVGHLQQMVARAIQNPINPQVAHFIFETLCVLIRKAYTKAAGGLDSYVLKIVEQIISCDFVDYVPYALQITALLLDQSKVEREQGRMVSQDQYLGFFPALLRGDMWTRSANVPALILVFESYIAAFPQVVLGAEYLSQTFGVFQRLISLKSQDHHGIRLAIAFLPYLDTLDFPELTSQRVFMALVTRRMQRTPKFAKLFLLFFFRYAFVKGGRALVTVLEQMQVGLFVTALEKTILSEMDKMPHATTYEEKRIIALGAGRLIADCVDQLGALYTKLADLSIAVLEVYDHKRLHQPTEESLMEELTHNEPEQNETEYSDPYCKLSYAQHIDFVGQEVTDVRKYLAHAALVAARQVSPQSMNCLSEGARNVLNSYAAAE